MRRQLLYITPENLLKRKLNRWFVFSIIVLIILLLGSFLDPTSIITIAGPISFSVLVPLGFDSIWLGVVFVILLECGYLTPPSGKTLKENLETAQIRDRKIIYPLDKPIEKEGGLIFLWGNLAPNGALVKQTAVPPEMYNHEGPARIFLSDEEVLEALHGNKISPGDTIVVRYNGPKGAPGTRMVYCTVRWLEALGLTKSVALITDGRFSGYCKGCMIGHISPEAAKKGPLAVLKDGDIIQIDIANHQLKVDISQEEMKNRRKKWQPPKRKHKKGILAIYEQMAKSSDRGASLDYNGTCE